VSNPRSARERLRGSFAEVLQHQALEVRDLAAQAAGDPDLTEALADVLERMRDTARSLRLDTIATAAWSAAVAVREGAGPEELASLLQLCRAMDPSAKELRPIVLIGAPVVSSDPLLVVAPDIQTARSSLRGSEPLAVVASVATLSSLAPADFGAAPRCAWGEPGDIDQRIAAARSGALAYFATPFDLSEIAQRIRLRVLSLEAVDRVLLVGADQRVAEHWASALGGTPVRLDICERDAMLGRLTEVDPALILLAGPRALDLSLVLRGHPDWWDVPRVLLSKASDEAVVDLTLPPLLSPESIQRRMSVLLDQARYEREQRALERSTGVMQRPALLRTLDREIATARRSRRPLAVARVELTEPAALAAEQGNTAVIKALRLLAMSVLDVVRDTDVVGRLGEHGYGVVMPGATAASVRSRLREIGPRFRQLVAEDPRFAHVSISAGAADTLESDEGLLLRAERDRLQGRSG
jgi:GGDEF domain-containing protein